MPISAFLEKDSPKSGAACNVFIAKEAEASMLKYVDE